jgi:hypothetical protein
LHACSSGYKNIAMFLQPFGCNDFEGFFCSQRDKISSSSGEPMQKLLSAILLVCLAAAPLFAAEKEKDEKETDRVKAAGDVLKEILDIPDNIPQDLLDRAECVIVLPSVIKFAIGLEAATVAAS